MKITVLNSLGECIGEGNGDGLVRIHFKTPIKCNSDESFVLTYKVECDSNE